MKNEELTDNKDLTFKDISDEQYRIYYFRGGEKVEIWEPLAINVSASGGHRIYTSGYKSYYIPSGWICLTWVVKPGKKPFSF